MKRRKRSGPRIPDPPINAIVTDMWATQGRSKILQDLPRQELEFTVIGMSGYLEALTSVVSVLAGMTRDEFWQQFCLEMATKEESR